MAPLTDDIQRKTRSGALVGYGVLANTRIFQGAMVGVTAALALAPAGTAGLVRLVGFATSRVDNTGGATGDRICEVSKDVTLIPLPGATAANIGAPVYATDDGAFTLTAGSNLQAGTIWAITSDGVWLRPV